MALDYSWLNSDYIIFKSVENSDLSEGYTTGYRVLGKTFPKTPKPTSFPPVSGFHP